MNDPQLEKELRQWNLHADSPALRQSILTQAKGAWRTKSTDRAVNWKFAYAWAAALAVLILCAQLNKKEATALSSLFQTQPSTANMPQVDPLLCEIIGPFACNRMAKRQHLQSRPEASFGSHQKFILNHEI